jgi:hypothetical protein
MSFKAGEQSPLSDRAAMEIYGNENSRLNLIQAIANPGISV